MLEIPSALIESCASRTCLLVGGSGLEASAGGKTWTTFVADLVAESRISNPGHDWDGVLGDLADGRYAAVEDAVTTWLPRDRILAAMWSSAGAVEEPGPLLNTLATIPFAGAVSLSWTGLLDRAFSARSPVILGNQDSRRLPLALRDDRFTVLRPWGCLEDNDVLLSSREFLAALFQSDTLRRILASLFASRSWLFVGASIAGLGGFLANAVPRPARDRPHFAVVVRGTAGPGFERTRLDQVYGLQVLEVDDHDAVLGFAVELARRTSQMETPAASVHLLRQIRLVNVGPFVDVTLPLHPDWTVLLGDNGSGKSTILKAIALALCGDDVEAGRLAGSLLRAGQASGSIDLAVGDDVLRTDFTREGSRVTVTARGVGPVQAGSLLALGFPPVRGVTTGDPGEVFLPVPLGPVTADLLPLLDGVVDHRLDDLKQWIVNVSGTDEAEVVLGGLFDALRVTGPNLQYVFDSIGPAHRVFVLTPDGQVSLDQLSQGMVSVLGWVGTLFRRLRESRGASEVPQARSIVLLDEIDAHLHPDWQGQIVSLAQKVFPDLQVVATTHSPLVVGSFGSGSLIHVGRTDNAPAIEVLEPTYEGWRADQVLTGAPFNLPSSRAPQVRSMLARLRELTSQRARQGNEEDEYHALREDLDALLPSPLEDPVDRRAADLIGEFAESRIEAMPVDERAELLARLRQMIGASGPDA